MKNKIVIHSINPALAKSIKDAMPGYEIIPTVSLETTQLIFTQHEKTIAAVVVELNGSYAWSLLEYVRLQREVKNAEFFFLAIVEPAPSSLIDDSPFINEGDAANETELATKYDVDSVVTLATGSADCSNVVVMLQLDLPEISPVAAPEPATDNPPEESGNLASAAKSQRAPAAVETLARAAQELTDELGRIYREINALQVEDTPLTWAQIDNVRKTVAKLREITFTQPMEEETNAN